MTERTEIVAYARTLINTPYRHQARLPGVGLDCIGVVIVTAWELGFKPRDFDIKRYRRIPDGTLMDVTREHMIEIDQSEMQIGDVVVTAWDRQPHHFCILTDYRDGGFGIVHAAVKADPPRVIETRLMFNPTMRFVAAFKFPGID